MNTGSCSILRFQFPIWNFTRFNMRLLSVRNSPKQNEPWLIPVGFEMVDAIAEAQGISMTSVSFKALFGKGWGHSFILQDSIEASNCDL